MLNGLIGPITDRSEIGPFMKRYKIKKSMKT